MRTTPTGPQGRRDGLLPMLCWCERQMRPMSEEDVWNGVGWACQRRECAPGCVPVAGEPVPAINPGPMRRLRRRALAESWRLRHELHEVAA